MPAGSAVVPFHGGAGIEQSPPHAPDEAGDLDSVCGSQLDRGEHH